MNNSPARIGALIGLALAVLTLPAVDWLNRPSRQEAPAGPVVLSDCDGAIRELVIHYVAEAAPMVETAYRDFLTQLPGDVIVHVVCPDDDAFNDLRRRIGATACSLYSVPTGHPMTCWSRDRWLALAPVSDQEPVVLLAPARESGESVWPARRGDMQTPFDLDDALGERCRALRAGFEFDGGDFVIDTRTAFVTPEVQRRNAIPPDELTRLLEQILRRDVALLPDAPPHHAGMFMMLAGDDTVAVGDPSLAQALIEPNELPLAAPDFSAATQARFDAVAQFCERQGYHVVRMPVIPDADGRTWLTWLNAILDQRDGRRIVYMPSYRGLERLNDVAARVWNEHLYCEVRPIDCTGVYPCFGTLRCLVNVLRRE
ncbi:hypothetical protein JXA32_01885 [Candidatus Sumerlaeota bacterium]|nr:hypothetical protein [Candidatus Sumerlaeota bacterium]